MPEVGPITCSMLCISYKSGFLRLVELFSALVLLGVGLRTGFSVRVWLRIRALGLGLGLGDNAWDYS